MRNNLLGAWGWSMLLRLFLKKMGAIEQVKRWVIHPSGKDQWEQSYSPTLLTLGKSTPISALKVRKLHLNQEARKKEASMISRTRRSNQRKKVLSCSPTIVKKTSSLTVSIRAQLRKKKPKEMKKMKTPSLKMHNLLKMNQSYLSQLKNNTKVLYSEEISMNRNLIKTNRTYQCRLFHRFCFLLFENKTQEKVWNKVNLKVKPSTSINQLWSEIKHPKRNRNKSQRNVPKLLKKRR